MSNFSGNVLALLVFTIYDIKKLIHLSYSRAQELREAEAQAKREAAEEAGKRIAVEGNTLTNTSTKISVVNNNHSDFKTGPVIRMISG